MIILVGGEKGGAGKSCLAQNLAVYLQTKNRDVLLLDADPQGTTTDWIKERDENEDLKEQVKTLKQEIKDIYQGLKAFVKENMADLKGFKALFKSMTHDISQNAPRGEFSRLSRNDREINRTRDRSR